MFEKLVAAIMTLVGGTITGQTADTDRDAGQYLQMVQKCEVPVWVGEPAFNSRGRLAATLRGQCVLKIAKGGSLEALRTNFINQLPKEYQIQSGPEPETFKGLPSVVYGVSKESVQDGDQVTIRSQLHVATDLAKQFIVSNQSTEVQGSGNAQYLKSISDEQSVLSGQKAEDEFIFVELQSVELEKPWFAPKGVFLSQAKKGLIKSFGQILPKRAQEMGDLFR